MRIMPSLDILNGKCVRLTKDDFAKVNVYSEDPINAREFDDAGIKYLHVVDLDGPGKSKIVIGGLSALNQTRYGVC